MTESNIKFKTVLVSAYAVNPYHGSEDGMGWNFINQIARFNKVIAITRENTRPHIEKYMKENPSVHYTNINFVYYDLPYWMRFWKKGGRGALLYYYMWQYFLPAFVKRQKLEFDIVHNLNFHNDWTPSRLWVLRKPFVWGPIGHHSKIPKDYILHVYGYRQYFTEQLKWMTKKYFWQVDPLLRQTVNHADTVLAMNSSVAKVLQIPEAKVVRMPSVSTEAPGEKLPHISNGKFTILSAGRFVPLKGFDITIKSFARFRSQLPVVQQDKVELVLVGDGPYKEQLVKLTEELYIQKQVRFIKWLDREDYKQLYANSHVFLFPSHEGAGMVVAEALSYGLPVVCFNNDGPGEFVDDTCGITVPYNRYDTSISKFAEALNTIYTDPVYFNKLSEGALEAFKNRFDWNLKGEHLRNVYNEVASRAV
jgi:glycosyltransferase involved in cell wall biosynthesis